MIPEDFQRYIRSNDFKELLAKYQQFLNSEDAIFFDADELLEIAEYYHLKNNPEESMRAAQCCRTLHPDNDKAKIFIARTFLMAGDYNNAEKTAKEISNDDLLDGIYLRAELMICNNNTEDANKYLREHYEGLSDSANAYNYNLIDNENENEDIDDMICDFSLDVAILFIDYQLFSYAEEWLSMVNDKEMQSLPDYLECKARLLTAQEKYNEAIPVWNAFIDQQAYSVMAWVQLSQCYYHEGNSVEALQCAQYAEAIDSNVPEIYLTKGNCLYSLGYSEESLKSFRKYLDLCPNDIQGELLISSTLYSMCNFEEARQHIDISISQLEALSSDINGECPDFLSIEVYRQAAYIYSALRLTEDALRYVDNLLFYNIPQENYHILRASILIESGKIKEAFQILSKLLKDSQHNPDTYINVGCMLVDSEIHEGGYKLLHEVFKIIDETGVRDGKGYDRLAFAALMTGRYEEFVSALEVCSKYLPTETVTIFCSIFPKEMPVTKYLDYARNNKNEIMSIVGIH